MDLPMSQRDMFGLPDYVLDILRRQSQAEGLELGWHVGGSDSKLELKLIWRPAGAPKRGGYNNSRKRKSPGNLKRDYHRMKQMLVDLNSVAVGTGDLGDSLNDCDEPNTYDSCATGELSTPISAPDQDKRQNDCDLMKKSVTRKKDQNTGVRTRQMVKNEEIENIRTEKDTSYMSESCYDCMGTPVKCDISTNSVDLDTSDLNHSLVSNISPHGQVDHCLQTFCNKWKSHLASATHQQK